jgi:hypothetical protein
MGAVFAGFIITILTLLLTQLPPTLLSDFIIQLILFFLALLFHFWVFLVGVNVIGAFLTVRTLPASVRTSARSIPIFIVAYWAMGMAIPLLFLIWALFLLAFLATVVWTLFFIVSILAQYEPLKEYRKANKAQTVKD